MQRVRGRLGQAGAMALRAYASDVACDVGMRLALLLVITYGLLSFSYHCLPAHGAEEYSAPPALCWETDPMCPPSSPPRVLERRP